MSEIYKNCENYNFAYDTVDAIAEKSPDRLAMIHLDADKNEKRFTFDEENFYVDLVLYNRILQCYVLVDLKIDQQALKTQ